jgi:hypothetical protein
VCRSRRAPPPTKVIRGWDIGIPGLAVTENTSCIKDPECRTWTVTHIASGCVFTGRCYTSPEAAVAFAQSLTGVTDWTCTGDLLVNNESVKAAVKAALKACPPDYKAHSMTVNPNDVREPLS